MKPCVPFCLLSKPYRKYPLLYPFLREEGLLFLPINGQAIPEDDMFLWGNLHSIRVCANGIVQVAKKPKRVVESILALITRHPAAFLVDKDATNVNDAIPLFTRYRHTKTLLYIS